MSKIFPVTVSFSPTFAGTICFQAPFLSVKKTQALFTVSPSFIYGLVIVVAICAEISIGREKGVVPFFFCHSKFCGALNVH